MYDQRLFINSPLNSPLSSYIDNKMIDKQNLKVKTINNSYFNSPILTPHALNRLSEKKSSLKIQINPKYLNQIQKVERPESM